MCARAHCVGRGRTHIAAENVHVHVFVLLAVLEVVAMFCEKCLVQMAELVLCTHMCTTQNNVISSERHGQASCVDTCVYLARCPGAPPRCGRRRHPLRCPRLLRRTAGSRLRCRSPVPPLRTSSEWKENTRLGLDRRCLSWPRNAIKSSRPPWWSEGRAAIFLQHARWRSSPAPNSPLAWWPCTWPTCPGPCTCCSVRPRAISR